jgi:hypothetical protein
MYNDENLIKIFNSVRKHENGGIVNKFQPGGTVSKTSSQQSAETEAKGFLRS